MCSFLEPFYYDSTIPWVVGGASSLQSFRGYVAQVTVYQGIYLNKGNVRWFVVTVYCCCCCCCCGDVNCSIKGPCGNGLLVICLYTVVVLIKETMQLQRVRVDSESET